jgi:capsular polysaccharide biosynthesis protein
MELRDYLRVFKRRAWIPVVLAIAAVLTAGTIAYLSKPSYAASATVLARNGGKEAIVVSFSQASSSNTVATAVIQKIGLNESVDHLIKRIHVSPASSSLYRITVNDASPNRASAVANEVARQATALFLQMNTEIATTAIDRALIKARDELQQQYGTASTARIKFQQQHPNAAASKDVSVAVQALELQVEEEAAAGAYRTALEQVNRIRINNVQQAATYDARLVDEAVAVPDTGGRMVEILSAGALALLVGIGLVFLLEYLDNAIREPEVVEEMVGAPVIGIIPRATTHSLRAVKGGA